MMEYIITKEKIYGRDNLNEVDKVALIFSFLSFFFNYFIFIYIYIYIYIYINI